MENRKVKVKVTHLTKKFGDLLVLNDVSFDVYDGEFLCIVGPTGCGKTTFLNSLTHLYEPTAGNILLDGEEIDLRKHNIAYIFQEYSAMEWLTVRENVRFGLDIKRDYKNIDEKVNNALDLVGLTPFADYYPKQLSASMLQGVVIARAFATQPDLLLMDEPFGALDAFTREQMQTLLLKLWHETGKQVLLITHDIEEAIFMATELVLLSPGPGRVVERLPLDFSRRFVAGESCRSIKSDPRFIEQREYILSRVFDQREAFS